MKVSQMSTRTVEVNELKVGKFVVIDGAPCKILKISTAKTGKHGSAKARIEGIGILDNQKRTMILPTDAKVEAPIIDKRAAQVLAFIGDNVQIMDLETYETFELPKPSADELEGKELTIGGEVEYIEVMGRRKITRVK